MYTVRNNLFISIISCFYYFISLLNNACSSRIHTAGFIRPRTPDTKDCVNNDWTIKIICNRIESSNIIIYTLQSNETQTGRSVKYQNLDRFDRPDRASSPSPPLPFHLRWPRNRVAGYRLSVQGPSASSAHTHDLPFWPLGRHSWSLLHLPPSNWHALVTVAEKRK